MNDDTPSCQGWTLGTLYTHFTALLKAREEALTVAHAAVEKRLEGMNEFRSTLQDQQRTLIPRSEAEIRMNAQENRIAALEKALAEGRGKSEGLSLGWSLLLGAGGLAGVLYGLLK